MRILQQEGKLCVESIIKGQQQGRCANVSLSDSMRNPIIHIGQQVMEPRWNQNLNGKENQFRREPEYITLMK